MLISFLGHLCVDHNIVKGREIQVYGGGALHGSVTAKRLGADSSLYTICAAADRGGFRDLDAADVHTTVFPSPTSTSIRNIYPSDDPDQRTSHMVSRARPFGLQDVERIEACDILHINPLWYGEFPPQLLRRAKDKARALAADAQGFVRRVERDGELSLHDWPEEKACLPLFDFLKADAREARALTGHSDVRAAAEGLHRLGARVVVLTHQQGVCVYDGNELCESPFSAWTLEGRTGRGDTCTAAFLVGQASADLATATRQAAEITSAKMQYPGPFRG